MKGWYWGTPGRARVVVSEGARAQDEVLEPVIGERFETILPWDRPWPISPRLALRAAAHAVRVGNFKAGYMAALLDVISPEIVVTYIDNSLLFQKVARYYKGPRFLAVQNGGRLVARDHDNKPVFLPEFACFGRCEMDQYAAYGAEVGRYHPIGSLKDAYYRATLKGRPPAKRYDLCYVSQIKPLHEKVYPKTMRTLDLIARHLRRFCEVHGTTLVVAARRHPKSRPDLFQWEHDWFRERLGEKAEIVPNVLEEYTSYRLIDESRVSLAMHTTLLREGFGRRNRILSCNFTGEKQYDFPVPGPWLLTDPSYDAFEKSLKRLLDMSEAEWDAAAGDRPEYLMGFDPARPTDRCLAELIASKEPVSV